MATVFNLGSQLLAVQTGDPYQSNPSIVALTRVQSANLQINQARESVFDLNGNGAATIVTRPVPSIDFSYYLSSELNEKLLGFPTDGSSVLAALNSSEQNYYFTANADRQDVFNYSGNNIRTWALGNAVITNYSISCAVGQIPSANVTIEGLNLLLQTGRSGQYLPSVSKQTAINSTGVYDLPIFTPENNTFSVVRPGDAELIFNLVDGGGVGVTLSGANRCPINSFSASIDLPRTSIKEIGWAYPEKKLLQTPITINVQANANVTEYQATLLNQSLCPDVGMSVTLRLNRPCNQSGKIEYTFNGLKLDSQSISAQLGQVNKINFSWSAKVYDLIEVGENSQNFVFAVPFLTTENPPLQFG